MKYLPHDTYELLKELEKLYPEQCIGPDESFPAAQRRAGQRDVVNMLKNLHAKTERKQLKDQQSIGD